MSENLIFPIGFDLESGVEEAIKNWDKYSKELERKLTKRAISLRVDFDSRNLDNLDAVKKRLAQIKIEPITPETKQSIRELSGELKQLAKALEQVQKFSKTNTLGQQSFRNDLALAREARLTESLEIRKRRAALAEAKHAEAMKRSAAASGNLSKAYKTQETYVSHLIKRLAVYAGYHSIVNFLNNVRSVTAEFELQRVSLGAIIQDQNEANKLYSEIKSFALNSPLSIMELTTYTKQVAAYRIETDKLFDTTKRLADVSVGLGVDMGRIVLAYGQVKAASYLRSAEIRQFTEAGIPMLELLAEKFTEMQGKAVSTAEVMKMVEKRMVDFGMVEQIFNDLTSAGGMFYNMQEKQGNTLFGLWAKLGDAASMMYDEIGNTGWINKQFKDTVNILMSLMENWRFVGLEMLAVGAIITTVVIKQKIHASMLALQKAATDKLTAAENAYNAVLKQEAALNAKSTLELRRNIAVRKASAKAALDAARAEQQAAIATNFWARSWKKLGAFLAANKIAIIIGAVLTLANAIYNAYQESHKLKNELDNIEAERITLTTQSVRNFEYLADAAVKAADGSKKQKDALEELQRTYREMIPVQDLTIEKLRALHGNYSSLTTAVREYIAEQQKQKMQSIAEEIYGNKQTKLIKKLREQLVGGLEAKNYRSTGMYDIYRLKLSEEEFAHWLAEFEKRANNTSKSATQAAKEAFDAVGIEVNKYLLDALSVKGAPFSDFYLDEYKKVISGYSSMIEGIHKSTAASLGDLGKYAGELERINKDMEGMRYFDYGGNLLGDNSFLKQQLYKNEIIKKWTGSIKKNLSEAGVEIKEEWFDTIKAVNKVEPGKISSIQFDEIINAIGSKLPTLKKYVETIQKEYNDLVPQDATVKTFRNKFVELADSFGTGFIDKVKNNLMGFDENLKDYRKKIEDTIKGLNEELISLDSTLAYTPVGTMNYPELVNNRDALKEQKDFYEKYLKLLPVFSQPKTGGGSGRKASDTRLQTLKEIENALSTINSKYDELLKKEGNTLALEHINEIYKEQLAELNKIGKRFGLSFQMPTSFKDLQSYRQSILDVINKLKSKGLKGAEKAALELDIKIGTANVYKTSEAIEANIKELADKVSRSKAAKEFYDKVLDSTGDTDLASKVAESIYGQNGANLQKALADQVKGIITGQNLEVPGGIISPDNIIDYKKLREFTDKYKDELGGMYKTLIQIADDGERNLADTFNGYLKELEKAKRYSDERIALARKTANTIAKINKSKLPKEQKEQLVAGYKEKEQKDAAKLEWDAFKEMPLYIQMFSDLDNASTSALTKMKDMLTGMQGAWKNLDPTQLKELQSRIYEINTELAKRNPFKTLSVAFEEYKKLREKYGSESEVNKKMDDAGAAYNQAKMELALQNNINPNDKEAVERAKEKVDATEEEYKNLQKVAEAYKEIKDLIGLSVDEVFQIAYSIGDLASGIGKITEVFGGSEEDVQYWNDIANGINEVTGGIENMTKAALSGNPLAIASSVITSVPKIISGFSSLFNAGKIKRANKEIARQQELLEQLEYTYSRLQEASDKLFGVDYINNYNQQIENLRAQETAYLKQAQAERSKGKKKDKEKIKEYEEAARETADKIKELEDDLVAHFTGQGHADAARQFAESWLEAKLSFANTKDAIKSDYQDLMKSMIVEGAAAKVIDNILEPMWKQMNEILDKDGIEGAFEYLAANMDSFIDSAANGLEVMWESLESKGYDLQKLLKETDSSSTGIARDIATASEESINGLAAGINTQNYYISYVPKISEHVGAIRTLMETGNTGFALSENTGWTDWQQQAMDNFFAIQRNTAETVTECRRIAERCEALSNDIHKVIVPRGTKGSYGIQIYM